MFGDAAEDMLKMMGLSGSIPGAIMPADVADAMESLKTAVAKQSEQPAAAEANADDQPTAIPIGTRAAPLLELLEAAVASGDNVTWGN